MRTDRAYQDGFTEELLKQARIISQLKPHQKRVVDRILKQPGLVVAHGLGSGKTLSSIAAAEALGLDTSVVVPASLQSNYLKEIAKHVEKPRADYDISSLQRAAVSGEIPLGDMLIVDEAHRLRTPGTKSQQIIKRSPALKKLFLTGTPLYNNPADLGNLVNLAAGQKLLPDNLADFEAGYMDREEINPGWWASNIRGIRPGAKSTLVNQEKLKRTLEQWVDYHENEQTDFPTRKDETIDVPLGGKQLDLYNAVLGQAPAWVQYKIKQNLPPSRSELKNLNAFLTGGRQISVSPGGFDESLTPAQAAELSPKIQTAFQRFKDSLSANPAHKALIYSNFLDAGVAPYEALLQRDKIPYGRITGQQTKKERDKLVREYNDNILRALLVSSAGGEGLDLKGTRQIQLLDPHWNKEKLEQVIGRGIRYKSHAALPEDQRNVNVEQYRSILPEPGFIGSMFGSERPGGIDEYLTMLAEDKDRVNQQLKSLLRTR